MKRRTLLIAISAVVAAAVVVLCIGCLVLGAIINSSPTYKATATARAAICATATSALSTATTALTRTPTPTRMPMSSPTPTPMPTPIPTDTPVPTSAPALPPGTEVELVVPDGGGPFGIDIGIYYMWENCEYLDVAHDFVPSGTRAVIASWEVCYPEEADNPRNARQYYYKVVIPGRDYGTDNNWVNAKYVIVVP